MQAPYTIALSEDTNVLTVTITLHTAGLVNAPELTQSVQAFADELKLIVEERQDHADGAATEALADRDAEAFNPATESGEQD